MYSVLSYTKIKIMQLIGHCYNTFTFQKFYKRLKKTVAVHFRWFLRQYYDKQLTPKEKKTIKVRRKKYSYNKLCATYKNFSKTWGEKDRSKNCVIIKSIETVVKTGHGKIKKLRTSLLSVYTLTGQ